MKKEIILIGSGLTALTINYFIKKDKILSQKYNVKIIEGRSRIGGRIFTIHKDLKSQTIEMGATWFGLKHQRFLNLLTDLNLEYFEQIIGKKAHYEPLSTSPPYLVSLPPNPEPSMRVNGGTSRIIEQLSNYIDVDQLNINETVTSIKEDHNNIKVYTSKSAYSSDIVISTLPPYLFHKTIKVEPTLPLRLTKIMESTHTWMGESIKIALVFKQPFWRKENGSGTIFSNVGPIPEMYDHCNYSDDFFALKGFLNGNYFSLTKDERIAKVLSQLEKYFGKEVCEFISYEETIWRKESMTFASYESHVLPHQNNGHQVYQSSYLNNRLFIAGSETAVSHPGYMEGAVSSAELIIKQLQEQSV